MQSNTTVAGSRQERTVHVVQGEYAVAREADVVLTTFLGSCVSTCLFDPEARVGGMNHFLLAEGEDRPEAGYRYGLHAMELLINGLLKIGADRRRLRAKLFGGAMMHNGLGHIGKANGTFAVDFLTAEGIDIASMSLGGTQARRIRFVPTTGHARQLLLGENDLPPERPRPGPAAPPDDITIF